MHTNFKTCPSRLWRFRSLRNIPFDLKDRQGGRILRQMKSDSNGFLLISNLNPGNYYLVQTVPSAYGYRWRMWLNVASNREIKITKMELW
ncbi:prealbumin-like fold domain-containing protein [Listeria aquatica]|uniref:prealbumin-like fold domain-containing protein n=1 Tax=Listeria aquatica TaxID=1494960 RepID=UPI003CFBEC8D